MNRCYVNRSIAIFRFLPSAFVGITSVLCAPLAIHAAPIPNPPGVEETGSAQRLLDELDDIDVVRYITPLKLTGEEIDKLSTAITDTNAQFDKKLADLRLATVGKMADEIHKRHKDTVAGGPSSKDFDDKVKAAMVEFYSQREKVYAESLLAIATTCGKILTADQKKMAAQLEKDMFAK